MKDRDQLPPHRHDAFVSMLCVCGQQRIDHMMGGDIEEHAFEPIEYRRAEIEGQLAIRPRVGRLL